MKFNNNFFNFFKGFYEKLTSNYQLELSKIEVKNEDDDVLSMSYKNFDTDFNGWSMYFDFKNRNDDNKYDMYIIIRKRVSGISYQINGFIEVQCDDYRVYDIVFDYIDTIAIMSKPLYIDCERRLTDENDNTK